MPGTQRSINCDEFLSAQEIGGPMTALPILTLMVFVENRRLGPTLLGDGNLIRNYICL